MTRQTAKKSFFTSLTLIVIFVVALIFRTYGLEKNSRFIWDESRALVDMHRIWENKEITFVGPISENNLEMFPSLTYYLLMPFTVLNDFDPLGPVLGTVIFGLLTWFILTRYLKDNTDNQFKWIVTSFLIAVFYPFVLTSRWAWNPNLILVWSSLALVLLFSKKKNLLTWLFAGLFLWTTIYHHYLSVFVAIPATVFIWILSKRKSSVLSYVLGSFLGLIPITIFELKNRYFSNWLSFSESGGVRLITLDSLGYGERVADSLTSLSSLFLPIGLFWTVLFYSVVLILILLTLKQKIVQYISLVMISSISLFGLVTTIQPHYLYALVPFILFLFINAFFTIKNKLVYLPILILIISSLLSSTKLIKSYTWEGDIQTVRNVSQIIFTDPTDKRINVASLLSSDVNTIGQRYRDMVLIKGRTLDRFDKYPESEVLYVVSTSDSEALVREDRAWEMKSFKGVKLTNKEKVSDYPFFLYRFEK
jgi:hypothetical protein